MARVNVHSRVADGDLQLFLECLLDDGRKLSDQLHHVLCLQNKVPLHVGPVRRLELRRREGLKSPAKHTRG